MATVQQKLNEIVQPVVESMGHEFVGIRYLPQGKYAVLRIYIDHKDGVKVENCSAISHQISGILDVEDPISGQYSLEVSSPGMDRPLFSVAHYQQFIGSEVQIRFSGLVEGRRKLKATIKSVEDEKITVVSEGETLVLDFGQIDSAQIVPNFD